MSDAIEAHIALMEQGAAKAARWIVRHQGADGTPPSRTDVIESAYKGIWSLAFTGHSQAAQLLAEWYRRRLAEDGDFPCRREEGAFLDGHYLYANGYIAIGARVAGRFDLAQPAIDFIATRQHLATGGFFSNGPHIASPVERMDTVSTSISAWAAIFAGRLDIARRAAEFLEAVIESQPDPRTFFFPTMGPSGTLLDTPVGAESHVVMDVGDADQDWYFIGLPPIVLAQLYAATSETRWLDLACRYLDYLDTSCNPGAFNDFSSGKSGVAAAHLFRLTGRNRYREIALHVADFILSKQTSWGFFCENSEIYGGPAITLSWSDLDMTLEYVLWLKLSAMHLA